MNLTLRSNFFNNFFYLQQHTMLRGEDEREERTTAISHGLKSHRAVAPEFKPVVDWGSQRMSELWLNTAIDLYFMSFGLMRRLISLICVSCARWPPWVLTCHSPRAIPQKFPDEGAQSTQHAPQCAAQAHENDLTRCGGRMKLAGDYQEEHSVDCI